MIIIDRIENTRLNFIARTFSRSMLTEESFAVIDTFGFAERNQKQFDMVPDVIVDRIELIRCKTLTGGTQRLIVQANVELCGNDKCFKFNSMSKNYNRTFRPSGVVRHVSTGSS